MAYHKLSLFLPLLELFFANARNTLITDGTFFRVGSVHEVPMIMLPDERAEYTHHWWHVCRSFA
jgi:hypothetical protein